MPGGGVAVPKTACWSRAANSPAFGGRFARSAESADSMRSTSAGGASGQTVASGARLPETTLVNTSTVSSD